MRPKPLLALGLLVHVSAPAAAADSHADILGVWAMEVASQQVPLGDLRVAAAGEHWVAELSGRCVTSPDSQSVRFAFGELGEFRGSVHDTSVYGLWVRPSRSAAHRKSKSLSVGVCSRHGPWGEPEAAVDVPGPVSRVVRKSGRTASRSLMSPARTPHPRRPGRRPDSRPARSPPGRVSGPLDRHRFRIMAGSTAPVALVPHAPAAADTAAARCARGARGSAR